MIPISDSPGIRRHTPIVMPLLIVANVVIFLYQLSLGQTAQGFVMAWGAVPYEITHAVDIAPRIPVPVYVTLLTSMFLHGGLLHLASNMLFLWVFGDNVEDRMGRGAFLAFYLVCGILAGLTQTAIDASSRVPSIGASGAIAGVLAAYLLLFPRAQVRTLLLIGIFFTITRISAIFLIGFWILLQLLSGLIALEFGTDQTGGVAYWAHIGGFVAGLILTKVFYHRRE